MFRGWYASSLFVFLFLEYFRFLLNKRKTKRTRNLTYQLRDDAENRHTETSSLLPPGQLAEETSRKTHYIKAGLYAFQNFYAFMLM